MIHYNGAVRDVVLGETMRSSWLVARTRGFRLARLLLVIRLRACVVGASIWKSFRFGSEILIGSASLFMTASVSIEGRTTWKVGPIEVKTITGIGETECSWWISRRNAEAMG